MSMRKWNKGFPPHTGWWNASVRRDENVWRWFDAEKKQWGRACFSSATKDVVNWCATTPALRKDVGRIEWTDYWP